MKKLLSTLAALSALLAITCKDSEMPDIPALTQATVSGQFLYKGIPVQFDGNPSNPDLSVAEYRKATSGVVDPAIGMTGAYKQQILTGNYLFTMKNTSFPFTFDDFATVSGGGYQLVPLTIDSNVYLEIPITPYFEITDISTAFETTHLNVTFQIKSIQAGAEVTKAKLFINTDSLVNSGVPASAEVAVTDITQPVTVQFNLPLYRTIYQNNFRDYAYIRIALETTKSTSYFLWSDVLKVENVPVNFTDITAQYLTNYQQPFSVTMLTDRWGKVNGWNADAAIEPTMYDGLGDRLFMGAENWGGPDLSGSVWQSPTLPAGKYIFSATRGWNYSNLFGRTDRAYLCVSKGNILTHNGNNLLGRADAGLEINNQSLAVEFELAAPTQISMGYAINFVGGETNAVSFTGFTILKIE